MSIGRLEPVDLRKLWQHEAHHFSGWLQENIEVLGEQLGRSFSILEREKAAGDFSVDLVAEEENGDLVIIENQLEKTDHAHLGKLVTYLTNLEAKTAIWIASEARPEHIRAVQWLNESTPATLRFYLVKLDAYRIGQSEPAPLFTVIVGPSAESKAIGQKKKDLAERHVLRLRFWEQLLERAKKQGVMTHAGRSPSKDHWVSAGAGRSGLSFNYLIWMEEQGGLELYIDTGSGEENKLVFDQLHDQKAAIEKAFGDRIEWQRLNERRASKLRYVVKNGGLKSAEDVWPTIQDGMIRAMGRFCEVLRPRIKELKTVATQDSARVGT